ncbi:MAG TPA: ubiquinol-cytochrome C chaperone family protein [Stellaceae bacterium]|nr:ubiquinol-cytochrome C chaperone family protein [Stellaceae bacterium]
MPFRRKTTREAAERTYVVLVEQARRPAFFTELGVPDTLDGRFELICLHVFLYLRRLKGAGGSAAELGQRLVDTMFADFDRSLREIGTGDLSVGRQVKRMAEAFYGRIRAYEDGLAAGLLDEDETLRAALARNLYGTVSASPPQVARMARYLRGAAAELAAQPAASLLAGDVVLGAP